MNKLLKYTLNVFMGLLFSLPVITLADSITAMHFVNAKLADNQDINVPKEFIKSFKVNFVQSIILTVIFVGVGSFLGYKWYTELTSGDISKAVVILLGIATFLFFMFESVSTYILAKFDNPISKLLLLVVFSIGSNIDCAAKMAFSPIFSIAFAIIIVLVNPGVISFTVALIFLLLAMIVHEILTSKWVQPIYKTLFATKERGEQAAREVTAVETSESDIEEISETETVDTDENAADIEKSNDEVSDNEADCDSDNN